MEIVKLSKKELREDIESGMKRPQIAEKYQLPVNQVNKAIKMAGLNGMRAKTVKFEFIDDEEPIEEQENTPEISIADVPHFTEGVTFGTAVRSGIPTSQQFD